MESHDLRAEAAPKRIQLAYQSAAPNVPAFFHERLSYDQLFGMRLEMDLPADLTLRAGQEFDIGDYGILGYAMMSASTLAQAVNLAVKYHRTAEPLLLVNMRADETNVHVLLENSYHLDDYFYRAVVEEVIATFPKLLHTLTGKSVLPVAVDLAYPDPGYAAAYRDVFNCEPSFDAFETSYVLSKSSMSLPLVKSDAKNFALLEQSCRELLDEIRKSQNFTNSVREVLLREVSSMNTASAVGELLNISERTLRRKLAQEQATFRSVLDDVRARLAKDYLAGTEMTAQEIAELLGYTESTNFRRAFMRWTRVSPQRYRSRTQRST
jgi:AraC-like DNA-binding protein